MSGVVDKFVSELAGEDLAGGKMVKMHFRKENADSGVICNARGSKKAMKKLAELLDKAIPAFEE